MTHYRATYWIFQNKKPWKGTKLASVPYPFTTKKIEKQTFWGAKWSFVKLSSPANLNIFEFILAGDEVDEGFLQKYKLKIVKKFIKSSDLIIMHVNKP